MDNRIADVKKLIDSGKLEETELALSKTLEQNPDSQLLTLQAELKLKIGTQY